MIRDKKISINRYLRNCLDMSDLGMAIPKRYRKNDKLDAVSVREFFQFASDMLSKYWKEYNKMNQLSFSFRQKKKISRKKKSIIKKKKSKKRSNKKSRKRSIRKSKK